MLINLVAWPSATWYLCYHLLRGTCYLFHLLIKICLHTLHLRTNKNTIISDSYSVHKHTFPLCSCLTKDRPKDVFKIFWRPSCTCEWLHNISIVNLAILYENKFCFGFSFIFFWIDIKTCAIVLQRMVTRLIWFQNSSVIRDISQINIWKGLSFQSRGNISLISVLILIVVIQHWLKSDNIWRSVCMCDQDLFILILNQGKMFFCGWR